LKRRDYAARKLVSLLYRIAGGRNEGHIADLEIFAQKARLYPSDNISERRAFAAPQFWDQQERALLGEAAQRDLGRPFVFLDIGANAGLYSLSTAGYAAQADRPIRIVAVEPDPALMARARTNFALSGIDDTVLIERALTISGEDTLTLFRQKNDLGKTSTHCRGEPFCVPAISLSALISELGIEHLDAMKMDIEGQENALLLDLFANVPKSIWPALVCTEVKGHEGLSPADLCRQHGYETVLENEMNAVLRKAV
jgi:FkbM family methyltransferase